MSGVLSTCLFLLFTWSLTLNTELTPLERHGVLYYIESGLMPNTGKRFEWEVGVASHNPLAATLRITTGPMKSCMPILADPGMFQKMKKREYEG